MRRGVSRLRLSRYVKSALKDSLCHTFDWTRTVGQHTRLYSLITSRVECAASFQAPGGCSEAVSCFMNLLKVADGREAFIQKAFGLSLVLFIAHGFLPSDLLTLQKYLSFSVEHHVVHFLHCTVPFPHKSSRCHLYNCRKNTTVSDQALQCHSLPIQRC